MVPLSLSHSGRRSIINSSSRRFCKGARAIVQRRECLIPFGDIFYHGSILLSLS
jgi:hypothetical protein